MLSESDISNITLAMGLAVFIIFTINNRIAAQYMDAPNNTLGVSSIAGLLVFTIFTVFISLLKSLGRTLR